MNARNKLFYLLGACAYFYKDSESLNVTMSNNPIYESSNVNNPDERLNVEMTNVNNPDESLNVEMTNVYNSDDGYG